MLPSAAQGFISIIAAGGEKAPDAFADLLQLILVNTILADNEKIRCVGKRVFLISRLINVG